MGQSNATIVNTSTRAREPLLPIKAKRQTVVKLTTVTGAQMLSNADILNVPHKHLIVYNLHPRAGKPMLTNKALEAITDFLSRLESVGITYESCIPWDEAESLFHTLSGSYFNELRNNLLNLNKEDASLYLCEAIESLSPFSEFILPNNDEINGLLAEHEAQKALIMKLEQSYSAALTEVICKKVEFKIDLGDEYFRAEYLAVRRDFREEIHRRLNNDSFDPDTMPADGWAWIYAEQVSFFLESIWLRVIELYERRCGPMPEALHWHSYSQWVKQHSPERVQLAISEAILTGLAVYDVDKSIFAASKAEFPAALPASQATSPDLLSNLCLQPFTRLDLTALLQHLGLLDTDGCNLTIGLRGKSRGKWSKFTAAYRILVRNGLMRATANDKQWATAFEDAYNAKLGDDARGYVLTSLGKAPGTSSKYFQSGVEDANFWVSCWKDWRGTSVERPVMPLNAL